MSKLDVYLRSIERFGAAGALLTSGQAVTLRFPTGDRHATQVTPHDQLVVMVREIAPPDALDQIDKQRPTKFEIDSQGIRYSIGVTARPGTWQIEIAPAAPAPVPTPSQTNIRVQAATSARVEPAGEMAIEYGQYDMPASAPAATTSGSGLLDQLTAQARGARATDIFLSAGSVPLVRANGEVAPAADRGAIDGDVLSREIGVVAPAEARAAWMDGGPATFAYSDGAGRVRVTLTRDRRGPGAALRLLSGEPPALERLNLGAEVPSWLAGRGLVVIAGASGVGKTTVLAAMIRALGERKRQVVSIEDPIELVHTGPSISQRAVREHVPSVAVGVAVAMREGADVIVVGAVDSADAAIAVVDAVAGGHLVLTTVVAPTARLGLERLLDRLPVEQRELARTVCTEALLGSITPSLARGGGRTYDVVTGSG